MIRKQIAIAAMTLLLAVAAMLAPLPLPILAAQARTIDVNARQFAFEPAQIQVQRGDTINLHFESLDAAHGLFVDGYPVDLHAEPGKSADITFVADQAGKFKIRCSVSCGPLHPFMTGEMQVEPDAPLGRALVATLIAAVGATVFFWRRSAN